MIDPIEKLCWHAGLAHLASPRSSSISDCTWLPNGKQQELGQAAEDLFSTLESVNEVLNGELPSEDEGMGDVIPRRAAYAVSEILRLLREFESEGSEPSSIRVSLEIRRRLEVAWNAILAGDIDELG